MSSKSIDEKSCPFPLPIQRNQSSSRPATSVEDFIALQKQTAFVLQKYGNSSRTSESNKSFKRWNSLPRGISSESKSRRRCPTNAFGIPRESIQLLHQSSDSNVSCSRKCSCIYRQNEKCDNVNEWNIDSCMPDNKSNKSGWFTIEDERDDDDNENDHSDVEVVRDSDPSCEEDHNKRNDREIEDRLFYADGTSNIKLQSAISRALHVSQFDSISTLLASNRVMKSLHQRTHQLGRSETSYTQSLTSMFLQHEVKRMASLPMIDNSKLKIKAKNTKKASTVMKISSLSLREVPAIKLNENRSKVDDRRENQSTCFNCWSAGAGLTCMLKNTVIDKSFQMEKCNLFLCSNWDIRLLRRRYRFIEFHEVPIQSTTMLKYDNFQKKFKTVTEFSHPIYRFVAIKVANENYVRRRTWRIKIWLKSFTDMFASESFPEWLKIDYVEASSNIQLIRSLKRRREVENFSRTQLRYLPQAPITGTSYSEICGKERLIDNQKVSVDGSNSSTKNLIRIGHALLPKEFFNHSVVYPKNVLTCRLSYQGYSSGIEKISSIELYIEHIITISLNQATNILSFLANSISSTNSTFVWSGNPTFDLLISLKAVHVEKRKRQNVTSVFKASVSGRLTTRIPCQYRDNRCLDICIIQPDKYKGFDNDETCVSCNISPKCSPQLPIVDFLHNRAPHRIRVKASKEDISELSKEGFPLVIKVAPLDLSITTKPQTFVPSSNIVTINTPKACESVLAYNDSCVKYPPNCHLEFTSMKFFDYLKSNRKATMGKHQTFTCSTRQQPGLFLKNGDSFLSTGTLTMMVHRNWTYKQFYRSSKFFTEDGEEYWYDHSTKQTFWKQPPVSEELVNILDGGVISSDHCSMHHREKILRKFENQLMSSERLRNMYISLGIPLPQTSYSNTCFDGKNSSSGEIINNKLEKSILIHSFVQLLSSDPPNVDIERRFNDCMHDLSNESLHDRKSTLSEDERISNVGNDDIINVGDPTIEPFLANNDVYSNDTRRMSSCHDAKNIQLSVPDLLNNVTQRRVGKMHVDYIPSIPAKVACAPAGRLRPRSVLDDWNAVGFDPWSSGKQLLSSEYLSSFEDNRIASTYLHRASVDEQSNFQISKTIQESCFHYYDQRKSREIDEAVKAENDFDILCSLIRHGKYRELVNTIDDPNWSLPITYVDRSSGNTLLMVCCQNGNKRLAKLFLRRGCLLNEQNVNGQTCLHFAFGYGFHDLGNYLISKGANDSITNSEGLTCYEGISYGDLDDM